MSEGNRPALGGPAFYSTASFESAVRRPRMQIRQTVLALLLSAGAVATAAATEFCDGYKQGYVTGYKQAAQTSLSPLTPLCPLKPLKGFGDPNSDFEFGYTIGFKDGTAEGSRNSRGR